MRERLRPYIMAQMRAAHATGAPPMRPLFFDFPADEEGTTVEDQFMLGPDLLVAPVLEEGAREREVSPRRRVVARSLDGKGPGGRAPVQGRRARGAHPSLCKGGPLFAHQRFNGTRCWEVERR